MDFPPEEAGFSPEAGEAVRDRMPPDMAILDLFIRAPPLWSVPQG